MSLLNHGSLMSLGLILTASFNLPAQASDAALVELLDRLVKEKRVSQSERELLCRYEKRLCAGDARAARAAAAAPKKTVGAAKPATLPPVDYKIYHTFLLRDAYSPVAFITGDEDLSQKGATFSVTSDQLNRQTTFVGKGALMWAIYGNLDNTPPRLPISHFAFVPGVEWDRKVVNGKDSGSTAARAGLELETEGPLFPTNYWRATAVYTTDAKTKANVYGVESAWQPLSVNWWLNVNKRVLGSPVFFGFYPSLNADYFRSEDVGDFANLVANRDYFWVGPKLSAAITFDEKFLLKPLKLYANYQYLYDTMHPKQSTVDYLETGVLIDVASLPETAFSNAGAIKIDVHYTNGVTPRTLERVREWYAGLNLKLGSIGK